MSLTAWVFVVWGVFWLCWFFAAVGAKQGTRGRRARPPALVVILGVVVARMFKTDALAVHDEAVRVVGVVLFGAGLGLAVWGRVYLGRNWGMPMSEKDQPELVTSGPYRFIRHPIYSGLLLAMVGTALATNLYFLIALLLLGGYFIYSATVEERLLATTFPAAYPSYRTKTKMLIPFVL